MHDQGRRTPMSQTAMHRAGSKIADPSRVSHHSHRRGSRGSPCGGVFGRRPSRAPYLSLFRDFWQCRSLTIHRFREHGHHWDDLASHSSVQRGRESTANLLCGSPERVIREVRVAGRRRGLRMSQQLADYWQAQVRTRSEAGKRVTQVMEPELAEASMTTHGIPGTVQVAEGGARLRPDNDERIALKPGKRSEDGEGRGIQQDGLAARLAVRESAMRPCRSPLRSTEGSGSPDGVLP